jgi:hypothetical protein
MSTFILLFSVSLFSVLGLFDTCGQHHHCRKGSACGPLSHARFFSRRKKLRQASVEAAQATRWNAKVALAGNALDKSKVPTTKSPLFRGWTRTELCKRGVSITPLALNMSRLDNN